MTRSTSRSGFTLLEVLAALALASAAVAVVGYSQGGASPLGQLDASVEVLRDLDGRARLVASRGTPVVLDLAGARATDSSGRVVVERQWPSGIDVQIPGPVDLSRTGVSDDYAVQFSCDGRTKQTRVSGLTGWIEVPE